MRSDVRKVSQFGIGATEFFVDAREVAGSIGRALEGQSGLRTRLLGAVDSQAPAETALRALLAVESTSTPRPSSTAGASR